MIIVQLCGGMGNQMFQYAMGRNISIKYDVPLKLDLSFLKNRNMGPNFVYRDYDLDLFNIKEDFQINTTNFIRIGEQHFHYNSNVENILKDRSKDFLLCGYWQSPKYFIDNESVIRNDFSFKNPIDVSGRVFDMLSDIVSSNSIMLNVRRTDYLNTNFHGVMGMDYINRCVSHIENFVNDPKYFVFSDDVDWCRNNIKLSNMTIVDHSYKGDRFGSYLQLMKSCKHFVIPNSSFAWWSAWLNDSADKIVISPKKWFTDISINTNDLIPSSWIRI